MKQTATLKQVMNNFQAITDLHNAPAWAEFIALVNNNNKIEAFWLAGYYGGELKSVQKLTEHFHKTTNKNPEILITKYNW